MKEHSTFAYSITSAYVRDNKAMLEPYMETLTGWIRSRNLKGLASCTSILPKALSSGETYKCLMQIEAFFKKNKIYSTASCEDAAFASFKRGELICKITNKRLDHYMLNRDRLDPDVDLWVARMERWISSTLGNYKTFLTALPKEVRVTAGATSTRSRRQAKPHTKVGARQTCTPSAFKYLSALASFWGCEAPVLKRTIWNRVELVPKNWKTHRTIACEPEGNIPLQLAFDSYVKRRLRIRGIDLRDQSRNQQLAFESSISGRNATIDLSMASDTVSYNVVAALFPSEWFYYLCDVRSPCYRDGSGKIVKYEKFSSMGNGSTFCVETLIFAAACYAVGSKTYSVYGDDIIIEAELVENLLRLMRFLGFMINQDKSHVTGPFRESCGVNAYLGKDVTPFYLRDINKLKANWCHIVNGLASIALPGGELEDLLIDIVNEKRLPLVPFNECTMTGVHVDVGTAYSKGLLKAGGSPSRRRDPQSIYYKCFVAQVKQERNHRSRTHFLWHLMAYGRTDAVDVSRGREPLESSWVPMSSHKYVRKWVYWFPPVVGTPLHLYRWSDRLLAR